MASAVLWTRAWSLRLPRGFWRLWTVVAAARAAQFVEPFLPVLLAVQLRAGPGTVAVVLLVQQAAAVVGFVALGALSARLGVAGVLGLGLVTAAGAVGVLSAAGSIGWVVAGAAAFAAASALWRASAFALVPLALAQAGVRGGPAAAEPAGDDAVLRARAASLVVLASNLGAVVSAAVGAAGGQVRMMFAVQAVTTMAAGMLSLRLRGDRPRGDAGPGPRPVGGTRSARGPFWLVIAAVAPATALMFQAFSGLAVALPESAYRTVVLVNAAVLVLGQGMTGWLVRRVPAAVALAGATLVLGAGIAGQAALPFAGPVTVAWSLAELVAITVPPAVVAGLAPHASIGRYVGWFQAAQGVVATAAVYAGPALAGRSGPTFAIACLVLASAGLTAVAAARRWVGAAMRQPVSCPCGALLCACDPAHHTCASPTPVVVHTGVPARAPLARTYTG